MAYTDKMIAENRGKAPDLYNWHYCANPKLKPFRKRGHTRAVVKVKREDCTYCQGKYISFLKELAQNEKSATPKGSALNDHSFLRNKVRTILKECKNFVNKLIDRV